MADYQQTFNDASAELLEETNQAFDDWEDNTLPLVADSVIPYETSKPISSQTILVGCYKNKEHLEWIKQHNLYNIRLGDRSGAVSKSGLVVSASKLLLYDIHNPKEYKMFELD